MVRSVICALLVLSVAARAAAQSLPATVVARTGQAVAGLPGATYTTLGALPRLGAGGHVAFNAFVTGGGVNNFNDFGYWAGLPGDLQIAIREDSQNSGPDSFSGSANVGVDASGGVSMWTQQAFPVPANQNHKLWSYLPNGNGGNTIVAQRGVTTAPGFGAGAVFESIGPGHASNNAGTTAFSGFAVGGDAVSGSQSGLFAGTPGSLSLVARQGTAAPGATGTAPVFTTSAPTFFDKRINASGQVAFAAALSGAGVTGLNDRAIYVWSPGGGGLSLAVQSGQLAPGTNATTTFFGLEDQPGFNDAGQVAFRSQVFGDDVTLVNNYGIWAGAPGDVQLKMRGGMVSPIAGLSFRTPEPSPRINAAGQVAFFSFVAGSGVNSTNDRLMWVTGANGAIAPVAREGAAAAGTGAGVNFNVLDPISVINGAGQVALTASLTGTGVTGLNDRGLWAGIPGFLRLVAREGDVIDVDPGEAEVLKTISAISFANGFSTPVGESASAAFNDAGQIAWRAQFTDATTAILLSSVPLPSPSADFDGDLDVDADDLAKWKAGFGASGNALHIQGDADFDFDVDGNDFLLWQQQLGAGPIGVAVPEPASGTLAALALAAWLLLIAKQARESRLGAAVGRHG